MKKVLIEKLESFAAAPFTIQRISELLSDPRKQYSRIDKFMRAVEKTILVVSTVPPGRHRSESENGDSLDSALNGDFSTEVNVDIDMDHEPGFSVETKAIPATEKEAGSDTSATETTPVKESTSPKKEGEAGTSAAADNKLETEAPAKTLDASLEISAETPHVASSPTKINETTQNKPEEASTVISDSTVHEDPIVAVTAGAESVKPIDEAHLNEPIRSTGNEILVDTSVIPSEPTPLAALENIVAIQTESSSVETPLVGETVAIVSIPKIAVETAAEEVAQESAAVFEESEIEAKRPKLSEAPEVVGASQESPVTPSEDATPAETSTAADATDAQPTVIEQTPSIPAPEQTEDVAVPSLEDKIDESLPEVAEIPVEMTPQAAEIAEAAPAEMETVPTVSENTMSLDEEEPPAIELEMTPIAKMDTDETEAAPMDFEDDAEPMDQ